MSKKKQSFLWMKEEDLNGPFWTILNALYLILWIISILFFLFGNFLLTLFNFILSPLILAIALLIITKLRKSNKNFQPFFAKLVVYAILILILLIRVIPLFIGLSSFQP